ncbi:MAG: SUMF1/EgtB/PvdO family nonheme iron enzyme [Ignavibacteriae bacterium]|nr:hypothetical protein [Ignavibacteriota bacterium]NOH00052.1 SUMF1/EgtB/PvdO family nonheme iron enzyme [Ignavibacteriota bacterium]
MGNIKTIVLIFIFLINNILTANNISIQNVNLVGQVNNSHTFVEFDISWDNSWRLDNPSIIPSNWDAVWVFLKYKIAGELSWNHATLAISGHLPAAGSTISTSSDAKGAFIYRANNGTGSVNWADTKLKWNYAFDGIADEDQVEVRVFAIEMVFIPGRSFYVGDSTTLTTDLAGQLESQTSGSPFLITGEHSLTLGGGSVGSMGNNNTVGMIDNDSTDTDDFNDLVSVNLPAAFPKGFNGFYIMKYEISQKQYVDFLNTLTRQQQNNRVTASLSDSTVNIRNVFVMGSSSGTATPYYRNAIRCDTLIGSTPTPVNFYCDYNNNGVPNELDDGLDLPCNFLGWDDDKAYADWAGLRPMTELEFEKAARGPSSVVTGEYSWGNADINSMRYNINNPGAFNENVALNALLGNALYQDVHDSDDGDKGPFRCGIFASSNSNRTKSGTGYYGVMDLSGNLTEKVVSIGSVNARLFTGLHGDGSLTLNGDANVSNWPIYFGFKGGGWNDLSRFLRISERSTVNRVELTRFRTRGFRCVRTAP